MYATMLLISSVACASPYWPGCWNRAEPEFLASKLREHWHDCDYGPGVPAHACCRDCFDYDLDLDVDLADYAAYQAWMSEDDDVSVITSVVQGTIGTGGATTTYDFTDSGAFSGATPKAAILISTCRETSTGDGTAEDDLTISIGFVDDTPTDYSLGIKSEHNLSTTETNSRTQPNFSLVRADNANYEGAGDLSLIANGVRLTITNDFQSDHYAVAILIGGTDVTAKVLKFTTDGTSGNTVTLGTGEGLTFEPDDVFFIAGEGFDSGKDARAQWSFGVAHNGDSITQGCYLFDSNHNEATSDVSGLLNDGYSGGRITHTGYESAFETTDFASSSPYMTVTTREQDDAIDVVALCLNYNDAISSEVGVIDSPTSTGSWSYSSGGFEPELVLYLTTFLTAVDSHSGGGNAGAFGYSMFTADDEYSFAVADEDAQGTTDTQTMYDDTALNMPQDDGSSGFAATVTSLDSNGETLNFSAAPGTTRKWLRWAIGTAAAAGDTYVRPKWMFADGRGSFRGMERR